MAKAGKKPAREEPAESAVDVTTSRVCERLRQLRRQRGWTLEQLAAVSGVSRSMLSQIERNQVNPTLAVAFRVARAFGRSLADLVEEPADRSAITLLRSDDRAGLFRDDKECRIRTLYPTQLEKDVEFYEVRLAPGAALRSNPHFAATREMLTVGTGKVAVTSGRDRIEIGAGDSAHYPADVTHAIENVGEGEALLYLVVISRSE